MQHQKAGEIVRLGLSRYRQAVQIRLHREEVHVVKLLRVGRLTHEIFRQPINDRVELLHLEDEEDVKRVVATEQAILEQRNGV